MAKATQFRFHRGGYSESMDTAVPVGTMQDLKRVLGTSKWVTVEPYSGIDSRNGWDTHVVVVGGHVEGFTDGTL